MNASAITAEYNPFHNGHKYHMEKTKELTGGAPVMVIMSGSFVQRGEPAVMSKRARVRCALENGADLVCELSVPWATAGAERFASAAVYIAAQTGIVDTVSFGCETPDTELMDKIAFVLNDPVWSADIADVYKKQGVSYAAARQTVVERVLGGDCSDILTKPDNILATEYIKAIRRFDKTIKPLAVQRNGAEHDSTSKGGGFASAMMIRKLISQGKPIDKYVPKNALKILEEEKKLGFAPVTTTDIERNIMSYFRRSEPSDFKNVPDVSEGIENRIIECSRRCVSLQELYDSVKTKRYAHSRIRRIVMTGYLGITDRDVSMLPPYLRVLGFNETGREMLSEISRLHRFPIVTKKADLRRLDAFANHVFELESKAQDLYYLATRTVRPCGTDMTDDIIIT